jgi:hypothetical protein
MLEDNDNLPEWVQSKITLAEDYISTVSNYMSSEIDEAALNELSKNTLQNYKVAGHKKFDSIRNNTDANSMAKKAKLEKGIKTASANNIQNLQVHLLQKQILIAEDMKKVVIWVIALNKMTKNKLTN